MNAFDRAALFLIAYGVCCYAWGAFSEHEAMRERERDRKREERLRRLERRAGVGLIVKFPCAEPGCVRGWHEPSEPHQPAEPERCGLSADFPAAAGVTHCEREPGHEGACGPAA